jgi:ATP-dependent DNA helicase DinG
MKAAVYDPLRTVVLTSATLSVEGSVDFLGERLGFGLVPRERFRFTEHPSPFDYARQALTLVPDDIPEPGSREYGPRVASVVLDVLLRTRGRAFILFTSYGLLRRTHEALAGRLAAEGIRALRQGELARSELLRRFRSGPPHALFGTDSFWEGVDVKGEALECVVIARLPFRVPSEPIQVARIEDLRERGRDPFGAFTVPQAVLKLKQGYGRLIRSSTDRGVVVVLDRRIVTKRYGRAFIASLPPARLVRGPTADVLRELEGFFRTRP